MKLTPLPKALSTPSVLADDFEDNIRLLARTTSKQKRIAVIYDIPIPFRYLQYQEGRCACGDLLDGRVRCGKRQSSGGAACGKYDILSAQDSGNFARLIWQYLIDWGLGNDVDVALSIYYAIAQTGKASHDEGNTDAFLWEALSMGAYSWFLGSVVAIFMVHPHLIDYVSGLYESDDLSVILPFRMENNS